MIPTKGWHPMASAPKNGTIVIITYHEWNDPSRARRMDTAWWMCDNKGEDWCWRSGGRMGTTQFADGWMHLHELAVFIGAAPVCSQDEPAFDL